ncbi:MAG TPA: hypothetical protein VJB41_03330 [Patescibacteria group bacterium]|nr:hypothetical protein [Patescibacteria group bacterium]
MSIKLNSVKNIYFYLVSLIALMMIVYGTVDILRLGLTTWVFTKANQLDQYGGMSMPPSYPMYTMAEKGEVIPAKCQEKCDLTAEEKQQLKYWQQDYKNWEEREKTLPAAQKQRKAVTDISMLVVAIPLFIFHWLATGKLEKSEA